MERTRRKKVSAPLNWTIRCRPSFVSDWIIRFFAVCGLALIQACNGSSGTGTPSKYSQPQAPGHFVIFNQKCYAEQNLVDLSNFDVDQVRTRFTGAGWTLSRDLHDGSCPQGGFAAFGASQITDSTTNNSDFVWYSGHGVNNGNDFGILVFYDYFLSDGCQNRQDLCFSRSSPGLPFSGPNLKWFFANASFSAEKLPYDWLTAFNQSGNGLHGFYGYENEPTDVYGTQLGQEFADAAIQSSSNSHPVPIRSAWIDAARANNKPDAYGVFELQSANQDQISGGSSNPPYTASGQFSSGNPVIFYDAAGQTTYTPSQAQSLNTQSPGSYQPLALQTEGWSDSYLSGLAQQNAGPPANCCASAWVELNGSVLIWVLIKTALVPS
jgi:hypothetical protein